MSPASPGELVHAAARGDQGAWEALVRRFGGLVWAVARGFRLAEAEAADVSQTTWLRLVEHLDRLREPDRVGAWLATTARNESLAVLRRQGRTVALDDEEMEDVAAPDPAAGMLRSERDVALWSSFATLSVRCQALLRLLVSDPPPSYEEVSAVLDMPVGSIGPTRARCLEHLRRRTEAAGITRGPSDSSPRGGGS